MVVSDQLQQLVAKLSHCQDSKSGAQVFTGVIRVSITEDGAALEVEETTWESESGEPINTKHIRA